MIRVIKCKDCPGLFYLDDIQKSFYGVLFIENYWRCSHCLVNFIKSWYVS
jgi:hypothetical protein